MPRDANHIATLASIGIVVAKAPAYVQRLLELHEVKLPVAPSAEELLTIVLHTLEQGHPQVEQALTHLIASQIEAPTTEDELDPVTLGLISKGVGAGINALGGLLGKKGKEKQAQQVAFQNMMAYQTAQQQAKQAALQAEQEKQAQRKQQTYLIGGGVALVVGLLVYQHIKKPQHV